MIGMWIWPLTIGLLLLSIAAGRYVRSEWIRYQRNLAGMRMRHIETMRRQREWWAPIDEREGRRMP